METPQVPEPGRVRFRARVRTRRSDEAHQDVLNNAVYLTLFEEARHAYFSRLGLLDGNRFPFLLAQCNVRFLAAGQGGAEVEVDIATTHLGTSSFLQAYRVRAVSGGAVWAEAEARLVCYDPRTGRSAPMQPAFRTALAEFESLA
jgi:acyl-CoA thioesterase FadM